jgi:KipI family sensor histidine kinase inhibitor
MEPDPQIVAASDHSLLVVFGPDIQVQHHRAVVRLTHALLARRAPGVRNIHPGYSSVLVSFDPRGVSHDALTALVRDCLHATPASEPSPRRLEIPVCYDATWGLDLQAVADAHGLSPDEVADLHTSVEYIVYFLGFSPGFPYMGTLPEALATPRLASPRTHVPAGSVALAGQQTGIYPVDSPGGWRILGRTPLRLFDPGAASPTALQMGDRVRFRRIDRGEFEALVATRSKHGTN